MKEATELFKQQAQNLPLIAAVLFAAAALVIHYRTKKALRRMYVNAYQLYINIIQSGLVYHLKKEARAQFDRDYNECCVFLNVFPLNY